MKKENPPLFNPVVQSGLAIPVRKRAKSRKPSRSAKTKRGFGIRRTAVRITTKVRRKVRILSQRIRAGLTARFAHLDRDTLKQALIACGIAAAIATTVVMLVKVTPLVVALLALMGLGAVLRMWDRIRSFSPI